jgi:hypothetical protein
MISLRVPCLGVSPTAQLTLTDRWQNMRNPVIGIPEEERSPFALFTPLLQSTTVSLSSS